MSLLTELRNKSKATKDSLAFFGASVVTGIIALLWLLSFSQPTTPPATSADSISLEETRGAFAQFFTGAKAQLGSLLPSDETTSSTASTTVDTQPAASSSIIIPTLTPEEVRRLNPIPIIIETSSSTQ